MGRAVCCGHVLGISTECLTLILPTGCNITSGYSKSWYGSHGNFNPMNTNDVYIKNEASYVLCTDKAKFKSQEYKHVSMHYLLNACSHSYEMEREW